MTGSAGVGRNIAVSTGNVAAVIVASMLSVPLLIDRLGLIGFGLWTLAQSLVIYITTAELGFGPALARFASIQPRGEGTNDEVRRILAVSVVSYTFIGLLIVALCHVLATPLVNAFPVPEKFEQDALATVRLMGWVAFAALVGAPVAHVLTGLERFTALTVTNVAGSVTFLAVVLFGLGSEARLEDVARAALLQWSLVSVLRLLAARDLLRPRGRLFPSRTLLLQLLSFSARLQIAVLATLLNTQTDRVVIGLVATASVLGQAGVAIQVAEAVRFLAYAAFTPMASRMATIFGEHGRDALDAEYVRLRRFWVGALFGTMAVIIGAIPAVIATWVGEGYEQASNFAILLLIAYGIGMLLSPEWCYLRALGSAGLEGRYGVLTVAFNVVTTVTCGLLFGAIGVVAATAAAYAAATIWAARRSHRVVPRSALPRAFACRIGGAALLCGAVTFALGQALLDLLPALAAFLSIAIVAGAALTGYVALVFGCEFLVSLGARARRKRAADHLTANARVPDA